MGNVLEQRGGSAALEARGDRERAIADQLRDWADEQEKLAAAATTFGDREIHNWAESLHAEAADVHERIGALYDREDDGA